MISQYLGRLAAFGVLMSVVGCATEAKKPDPEEVSPVESAVGGEGASKPGSPQAEEAPASERVVVDEASEPASEPELEIPPPAEGEEQPAPQAEKEAISESRAEPAASRPSAADGTPLIPRLVLFGNSDKTMARLSPDGTRLSYLAPKAEVMNVYVGPVDNPEAAKSVTDDMQRGVRSYFWGYDNQHILYIQDTNGDENWHVYSVDLESGETKDLTPFEGVAAQIDAVSEKFPEEIVVGINDRDPEYHDLYKINITSGEKELLEKNAEFMGYAVDDDYQVRFASKMMPDGSTQYFEPDGEGGWKEHMSVPADDTLTTVISSFDKSGQKLYLTDSRDRNTSALVEVNLADNTRRVLATNDNADLSAVMAHPTEKNIQAVSFDYLRPEWQVIDSAIQGDIDYLKNVADGELQITSRTLDDTKWIVAFVMDDGPVRYYLYDRPNKKAEFLFTNRKSLEGQPLAKMHPQVIKTRDGLELVSYLTLPLAADPDGDGRPNEPLPMVLLVHGGPWARDSWGYDGEHQLLANRGYAVLSVNYRGSTGLGKDFTNAGNKEWAGKMHDDLIDAVDWAVSEKIADPDRVAIMGSSYGGYATLVGLTFTPEKFACGVDIVGPSNIITLLNSIPPYWVPMVQVFKDRVGDYTSEEGQKLLDERSPLNFVEKIKRPLLIAQGANDPRVKQAESDQIVAAMKEKRIPLTYVLFPDEGHGFARPENSLAFFAVAEAFLAERLGGRFEPVGEAFEGSSITIPEGADQVPGIAEALKSFAAPQ